MRRLNRTKIIDPKSVLTDVDARQVENMIWVRLAPCMQEIEWVKFAVSCITHDRYCHEYTVQTDVKLASGTIVQSHTSCFFKSDAIVTSVDQTKKLVQRQLRYESSRLYLLLRSIGSTMQRLFGIFGENVDVSNRKCSGPAT